MKTLILDNFLSKEECKFLIKYYESNTENIEKFRDVFPLTLHFVEKLNFLTFKLNRIAEEFGAQIDWFQIVKWPKNSFQELHFDTAKKETILSSIVYLNDNFTEGETEFTKLNIKIKPKKGKALLFFNCNLHKNSNITGLCDVIKNSEHAGLPVKSGEKWIANFWIRLKSFDV